MKKKQAILNVVSAITVLIVNYYAQTGKINDQTIGSLSDRYDNLFTPAGYAFAIWGIIFLGLLVYSVYSLIVAFSSKDEQPSFINAGYWFVAINFANATWVFAWLYEWTGVSVLLMLFMLFGLVKITLKTNMERWDAPLRIIAFIWWPICIYSGWIAVATIANISAYLSKFSWDGGFLNETQWTISMIVIATCLNLFMIWNRNMREFALVGVWALVAIFFRHESNLPLIGYTAFAGAFILLLNIGIHGFKNLATNPIKKLIQGEV